MVVLGVGDPRCKVMIVMGKTDLSADKYRQQSQVVVPMDAKGVEIVRMLPSSAMTTPRTATARSSSKRRRGAGRERHPRRGRGFEIAQGRPGRAASTTVCAPSASPSGRWRACKRLLTRVAFGKKIADHSVGNSASPTPASISR